MHASGGPLQAGYMYLKQLKGIKRRIGRYKRYAVLAQYGLWYELINILRMRKITTVSQTIFSNAISWVKIYELRLRFHCRLFLRFELTIFQHWFRQWLGTDQATSHLLDQWWLIYWRIYASLGINELNEFGKRVYSFEFLIFIRHVQFGSHFPTITNSNTHPSAT